MAELHVQRKRNNYGWLWLMLAILIIGGALFYYFNYYKKDNSTGFTTNTDSSYHQSARSTDTINTTNYSDNLWSQVNFDSPDTTYAEISDKKVSIKANAHFVIYYIVNKDLFSDNESGLNKNGRESLQQVRTSIGQRFNAPDIKIYNQTDTSHIDSLAMERAESVSGFLGENSKIDKSRITVYHPGEPASLPTKSNTVNIVVKR